MLKGNGKFYNLIFQNKKIFKLEKTHVQAVQVDEHGHVLLELGVIVIYLFF